MDTPKKSPEQHIPPHEKQEFGSSNNESDDDSKDSKSDKKSEKSSKDTKNQDKPASFFAPKQESKKSEDDKNTKTDSQDKIDENNKHEAAGKDEEPDTFENIYSADNESINNEDPESTEFGTATKESLGASDNETESGLSEQESHQAVEAIVDAREQEVVAELSDTIENSPEEFEAIANAILLDEIRSRASSSEDFTEESIDKATEDTLSDIESLVDLDDSADDENDEIDSEEDPSLDDTTAEEDSQTEEDDPGVTTTATPPIPLAPISPITPIAPTGGGGTPPPIPPTPPLTPGGPPPHIPAIYARALLSPPITGGNTIINNTTVVENHYINRRRRGRDMLIGGIIGYMIGRRGGRKRTEKKLIPKIDKLEKEVGVLHDKIAESEDRVRLVARRLAEKQLASNEKINPKVVVEKRKKRLEIQAAAVKREQIIQSEHYESVSKSRFESLAIFREKRLMDGTENSPLRTPVEAMRPDELSEKLKGVRVDGILIFEAFLAGRLSLDSLREVAKHYMRGGPYEMAFRSELMVDAKELEQKRTVLSGVHESSPNKTVINLKNEISSDKQPQHLPRGLKGSGDNSHKKTKAKGLQPIFWPIVVIVSILIVFYLLK